MFQLDLKSRASIYEQIVDNFKDLIISGILKPDDRLPSVRELSKMLTVNPNTIQKAFRDLEYQGFVYTVSGLGTFVATPKKTGPDSDKLQNLKTRLATELKELLYLGLNLEEADGIWKELLKERSGRT